ncbi:hypothetical protein BDU57DRAFT_574314 [Ampelomyces quisqualis]|uniref:CR-type domain-containing protein n=1 Tax=Ampelomyces quisqualis TaxID=50730 RepID=A0A6A5QNG0_AMPQU|nr:hypothetical protein BDU57DRAFT_574314 [Ampelomyces quisqualis]
MLLRLSEFHILTSSQTFLLSSKFSIFLLNSSEHRQRLCTHTHTQYVCVLHALRLHYMLITLVSKKNALPYIPRYYNWTSCGHENCGSCNGRGYQLRLNASSCATCNGHGTNPSKTSLDCRSCDGRGKILSSCRDNCTAGKTSH